MATARKPFLFSLACPWAGPSWDLDQKVPRAPDSEVANPVLSCPRGAEITRVWAAGVLACGEPHLGPRDHCSGLCQLQWFQQLCTSACTGIGVPRAPPGPPSTHRDAHIHATGSLSSAHKSACSSHPQQEVVTWTICWDIGHEASTCVRVPVGCALSTTKTHRLQNVTQLTGSKTETFVSKAARAGTRGTRTAHVSQPVQQLPRSGGLETHSDGSLRAI